MRRFISCDTDGDATGHTTPPPPPADAPDATTAAELATARAELATAQQQLVDEKKWADAARGYDAKLAAIQRDRPEDFALISDAMAGRAAVRDVTDAEDLDDATKGALAEMQTQLRQANARTEALTKQMDQANDRRLTDDVASQIDQAREEMGTAVVDALLPQINDQVRANESLTRIPGGVLTLLRAADHGQVADRLKATREADEDARQAKLARTRGLPARGLGVETTPGSPQPPMSALDALNMAIRTEEARTVPV